MIALEVDGLSIWIEKKPILKNLAFTLEEGEFVSIIGPSGCGKSTLFQVIGGLMSPTSGEIRVKGQNITGNRGLISYMPQQPALLPWRTILENVVLGQELRGQKNWGQAKEMLALAGLSDNEASYPHTLSGGMRQRAAFIRALLSPQPILCLDEPFSALDEFTRQDMQKWLLELWAQDGRTVLFITHSIEEALFLSDRLLILSERPARVIADIKLPFTRPRWHSITETETFFAYKKKISNILRKGGAR
ncbi:ABC transporter ATP-binding protein [Camelliibacillus cellulosilyticus]|uniref:ABC transporter ATP-binding protein n=1 Tax=Camelliibacillus cellulosilyticus TaxID=2174486 RepID=A0ABV9GKK3_9BACL